ncbi:unnamed protein product, partial [Mesorhabditis belari]|uniref:Fas apoptotic inhibitory molecule 1 n=1 Tax=Mesorhabditis belari TaxID=2138241 RepID=A0AAF3E979_9BILA
MENDGDIVARWTVPLQDHIHVIEFEHGTTTGRRVLRVDGKEILKREWMFKLVGKEHFNVANAKCQVTVEAMGTFAYNYSLEVNGKKYETFREEQKRKLLTWETNVSGQETRICLDKDTMEVWANGKKIDTAGEFVEGGSETHFELNRQVCVIRAISTGRKKTGVAHELYVNNTHIPRASTEK